MRSMRCLAVLAVVLTACTSPGEEDFLAEEGPPGCTPVRAVLDENKNHVSPPDRVSYDTNPPTSGMHYPTVAPTGIHDEPIQDEFLVHNMEHGHVIVHHNGLTDEQFGVIEGLGLDPAWVIVVPRPQMEDPLALTAWGKIQVCSDVPDDLAGVVSGFVAAYRDDAPESIPGR